MSEHCNICINIRVDTCKNVVILTFLISLQYEYSCFLLAWFLPPIFWVCFCTYLSFQLLELIKNPDMIEEMMNNEDKALENLQSEQENPEVITDNSDPEAKLQVWLWKWWLL